MAEPKTHQAIEPWSTLPWKRDGKNLTYRQPTTHGGYDRDLATFDRECDAKRALVAVNLHENLVKELAARAVARVERPASGFMTVHVGFRCTICKAECDTNSTLVHAAECVLGRALNGASHDR